MQNTMMDFPLTLAHILKRAGQLFGNTEIVSRLPDKSLHRYRYRDFHRRALALAAEHELASIAFPSISTGAFRFPLALAAPIAIGEVRGFLRAPSSLTAAGDRHI